MPSQDAEITVLSMGGMGYPTSVCLWPKYLREQFKEENAYFVSQFQKVQPWLLGPMHWGRTSWWRDHVEKETAHLIVNKKQRTR
jgi:hypothetical protein